MTTFKKITEADTVTSLNATDQILTVAGGSLRRITYDDFVSHINDNDSLVLNELAFYIDVNVASSLGSTRVNTGGNAGMRQLWEEAAVSVLMDKNGNYCELNPNDNRYTVEGDSILNEDGTIISTYANCDMMKIVPVTYGRVQTVTVGTTTFQRLWLSLVPLPGGYIIPQIVVGKFKCSVVSGALRSLPGVVPTASNTVRAFWEKAQTRSKSHGLANLDFRNHLLFHMMAKYAWRDSQNCKGSDGTLVWGVGLDGTESTGSDKFACQRNIKTGVCLGLGDADGKVETTDSNSTTVHCVNVAGFENPWGQYWEMIQGLCTVGTDVYCWRGNIVPSGTPTADTFANIDHVLLTRPTSAVWGMNIVTTQDGQGVYMIPKQSISGISYGDNYWYAASGQLWLFGGSSSSGSDCGLAYATSTYAWSASYATSSARLAYYGSVQKVSAKRLAELAAA